MVTTTLVVGATGNTGKYVVQFLLDQGQKVKVIARSKDRMMSLLKETDDNYDNRLEVTEAAILRLSDSELKGIVKDCDYVVSCLGHTLDIKGLFGREDRWLVRDTVKRLTQAMPASSKFILMGSEGVAHPDDDKLSFFERSILVLLRYLITPHVDNEEAAAHMLSLQSPEWCVVRPTDLQDGEPTKYQLFDRRTGSLFGGPGIATRSTVAKFMVDLIMRKEIWEQYKFKMPVIHDQEINETNKSK